MPSRSFYPRMCGSARHLEAGENSFGSRESLASPMESIRNLDYTILTCNDLPQTTVFYREVMRFPIEIELENWVNIRIGSSIMAIRIRFVQGGLDDGPHEKRSAAVQLAFRVPPSKIDDCY